MEQKYVLIVDDSKYNLKLIGRILEENDYKIALALHGKNVEDILEKNAFDLILLDIMMPDIDGYELCKRLKENPKLKEIPVIFITAKTETDDIVKGFNTGGVDYITKPFRREELLSRVNSHIELYRSKKIIKKQAVELKKANKRITDSIIYARHLQHHILPKQEIIKNMVKDSLIISRPKDIVSGDFYWFSNYKEKNIILVADCTGHGVPGALISFMAITLLNKLCELKEVTPAAILEYMRDNTKNIMQQTSIMSPLTEGMDMAVVEVDSANSQIVFAGANIGLTHINSSAEFAFIEPDHMPIAVYQQEHPFQQKTIKYHTNDCFYICTDGLKDLFNEDNKKFRDARINEFIKQNYSRNFKEQSVLLNNIIDDWKGNVKQTDDITVLGFRV